MKDQFITFLEGIRDSENAAFVNTVIRGRMAFIGEADENDVFALIDEDESAHKMDMAELQEFINDTVTEFLGYDGYEEKLVECAQQILDAIEYKIRDVAISSSDLAKMFIKAVRSIPDYKGSLYRLARVVAEKGKTSNAYRVNLTGISPDPVFAKNSLVLIAKNIKAIDSADIEAKRKADDKESARGAKLTELAAAREAKSAEKKVMREKSKAISELERQRKQLARTEGKIAKEAFAKLVKADGIAEVEAILSDLPDDIKKIASAQFAEYLKAKEARREEVLRNRQIRSYETKKANEAKELAASRQAEEDRKNRESQRGLMAKNELSKNTAMFGGALASILDD